MPIKIKIGNSAEDASKPKPIQARVSLKVVKTLSGNLLIDDHQYMDIVIDPTQNKIITLPKPDAEKDVFEYQKEFFYYLFKKGLIAGSNVEGGATFGMVEADYTPKADAQVDPIQALLFQIDKYIHTTEQDNLKAEEYDENIEDRFVDPPPGEYTPYGKIPPYQDTPAGSQDSYNSTYAYAGYGYLY